MSHHFIDVTDLRYHYPDGTPALNGISFRVSHGASLAVVGANGAGKTTLLQHLNGSIIPVEGSVNIGGSRVSRKTLNDIRKNVGMVFNDPDDQLFMPSVGEDVAFGPLNLGWAHKDVEKKVIDTLLAVDAGHLIERPPFRLSSGEKRRAALATVLVMNPEILVLDEPASGLDPRSRRMLIELLKQFAHTKIIATHDLELALELCDRTLVLADGRVSADGPIRELFDDRVLLESNGLEQPLSISDCPKCGAGRYPDPIRK